MAHVTVYMTTAGRVTVAPYLDHKNYGGQHSPWCSVNIHEEGNSMVQIFVDDVGNTRQLIAALQDACERIEAANLRAAHIPLPINADDMRPTTWGGTGMSENHEAEDWGHPDCEVCNEAREARRASAVYRWRYRDPETGLWVEWMDYEPGTTVEVPMPGVEVQFTRHLRNAMISDADAHTLIAECLSTARAMRQAGVCGSCPVGGVEEAYKRIAARIAELNKRTEPKAGDPWPNTDRRRRA